MDYQFAQQFAHDWIDAWNSRDIERIFAHYTDDFEITSPLVIQRMNEASGTLRGKGAIRPYWQMGLVAEPPLHFDLEDIVVGVGCMTIIYRRMKGRLVAETLFFNDARQIYKVVAAYGR